jgi:hypothetical protein
MSYFRCHHKHQDYYTFHIVELDCRVYFDTQTIFSQGRDIKSFGSGLGCDQGLYVVRGQVLGRGIV